MFNQKVNGYLSQNPEYLNVSYSSPAITSLDIHNCGTTINKYKKVNNCSSLPLQSWCSKNVAVESFAMRPIVNSNEYFESINKYLSSIIYTESIELKKSGLTKEHYYVFTDYGYEPESSFIQAIKLDVSDKLSYYMAASSDQVSIFKDYNPLCEGFVITDIDIVTYKSQENPNHFFHKVLFSAFNTSRYNTVSFKAEAYQDTTPMINQWNNAIKQISMSKDTPKDINKVSTVYVSLITLLNKYNDESIEFKGYQFSPFSQLINENFLKPVSQISWEQPNAITLDTYNTNGNYDQDGHIRIVDFGPNNIDEIIKNNLKDMNVN